MLSINARHLLIVSFCALFLCMCLVKIMLRNCSENKFLCLKMIVLFIITIFRLNVQIYLLKLLIHNA